MHKKLITLILAPALLPAAVMAQTTLTLPSITLYGKLDLALETVNFSSVPTRAGQTMTYLSNDISYLGATGNEDLGGGSRTYFKLESGLSLDTGTSASATKLFDREAYIGYGNTWGSVQLGSQFSPALFLQSKSDAYARHSNGGGFTLTQQTPGNLRGFAGAGTLENAVQYLSPKGNPFSVRVLHTFSEKANEPSSVGRYDSASLEYAKDQLFTGVAYEDQSVAGLTAGTQRSNRTLTAGLTYDFKVVKLFSYLMRNQLEGEANVNAYQIGAAYPMGADTLRATFTQRTLENTDGGGANTFAVGYYRAVSDATTLYASYAQLNNGTATNLGIWPSMKSYLPALPVGGQSISSFLVGIRRTF